MIRNEFDYKIKFKHFEFDVQDWIFKNKITGHIGPIRCVFVCFYTRKCLRIFTNNGQKFCSTKCVGQSNCVIVLSGLSV